ncbi:MAG: NDP-sugar synthase [Alloprevotella sp.]|nr:NDP-sugar synthase [Alloprevotella sp.]
MKYAIIAAGEGSRLAQEGISCPKALTNICGKPVVERLIEIFIRNEAEEIVIIINAHNPQTQEYLNQLIERENRVPIRLIIKSTPSSMHSFYELSSYLQDSPFCLTTVDTIFKEEEFRQFIQAFKSSKDIDGLMAVTDYIDDEKPLFINTDSHLNITAFLDKADDTTKYISGGIYALTPCCIDTLHRCIQQNVSRMRNFQRELIADHRRLKAHVFSKILDVDHAEDIHKAEEFLRQQ